MLIFMDEKRLMDALSSLCETLQKNNQIDPVYFEKYGVKRGLRNADGSGVLAGLTRICSVHGYVINDAEKVPVDGQLFYRGYDLKDIVESCEKEHRFCFEEVCWLLLFGTLPTKSQLDGLCNLLGELRELPQYFAEDMIIKAPSPNIMNKMARSVLALYSYDQNPEDPSLQNLLRQALLLIARMPAIMGYSYQVKRRHYDKQSMFFHPINTKHSTAEMILASIRADRQYTPEEAQLLDLCLTLHAEHGGGNNSTFPTRVLASSGTDTYSIIAGAIGSLKGPRHGGANAKVAEMLEYIKQGVKHWDHDDEVADFLGKLIDKKAGDRSGLIYGMGHAVYTLSDPRAVILKKYARGLAEKKGFGEELALLESIERLAPQVFAAKKGDSKIICANVDLYSGFVYRTLGIPSELFTPLFAVARTSGWCAHRIEEALTGNRIIRPAYKSMFSHTLEYVPLDQRG